MPYGNHIAYTSKAVKVSLFDLSQQLLPTVTFSYRESGRWGEKEHRAKIWPEFTEAVSASFSVLYAYTHTHTHTHSYIYIHRD